MPATYTDHLAGLSTSVAVKAPCRTVATTNITLSGLQTISGYTTAEDDRVLVKGQTDQTENGIYLASSGAWTRAKDADGNRDFVQGTRVLIRSTTIDGVEYELTTANPIVIGTSSMTFELRYGANAEYDQTEAEIAAGVTPTNYAIEPGNLLRYGADVTGVTDSTDAINNAISAAVAAGGTGRVFHPGGLIRFDSQIDLKPNLVIEGVSWSVSKFIFHGGITTDAFVDNNFSANNGAIANIILRRFKLYTPEVANSGITRSAIKLLAGGASFYMVEEVYVDRWWKNGIVVDGCEISDFRNNWIACAATGACGIWVVSGDDNITGQDPRYSNNISIRRNHIRANDCAIASDGGSNQWIDENNIDGASVGIRLANLSGFTCNGNEIEGTQITGSANILVTDTGYRSGASKGGCYAGQISANYCLADMAGGGGVNSATIKFTGSSYHYNITVRDNGLGDNLGASGDIDLQRLANSVVGPNLSHAASSQHYINTHNDQYGNTLYPPNQDRPGPPLGAVATYLGDNRYPWDFYGGISFNGHAAKLTRLMKGSATWDPGNITTSSFTSTTITVTGAALGDHVTSVAPSTALTAGMQVTGQVTAADTVTIALFNSTGSDQNFASATWTAVVERVE